MYFWFKALLLISIVLLPPAVSAQQRGVTTIQDISGNKLELYQKSYALLIGVSNYTAGWPDLESIPAEIKAVKKVLEKQGFHVVTHINPDHSALEDAFQNFIDDYGFEPQNRLLFFYSGHGETRKNGRKGYLVPANAPLPERDKKGFLQKALPMSQIMAWARQIEAKHALFLFDSCFSGTVFKQRSLPEIPPHISSLTAEPVRQFITAGSAGEPVPANSVFAPIFIDGLKHGLADLDKDGYITGTELGVYLQGKVPKHARQTPQFGKITDYDLSRGDFVFLLDSAESIANKPISKAQTTNMRGASNAFLPELVYIPADVFDMGEQDTAFIKTLSDDEKRFFGVPGKRIQISKPFYLSKHEITFEQYDHYVKAQQRDGHRIESPEAAKSGRGKQPVVYVDWFDAMAYSTWLGESCRLPTEAEWEYAARAGSQTAYPWSDDLGSNNANCAGCGSQWDNDQTAPVEQFPANAYGLYDMSGNVWEWTCSSWRDLFDGSEQQCLDNAEHNQNRVVRGGSWLNNPGRVRSSARSYGSPNNRVKYFGFRVLCSSPIE